MQLNNFEKQTQQKLNNREIKPSANSWDRLDAMLSVEEKPKTKRGLGFFFMAASFLLFASIGFYIYNQNEVVEINKEIPIIVNVENNNENNEEIKESLIDNKKEIVVKNDVKSEQSNQIKNQQVPINKQGVSIINQSSNIANNTISENNTQKATNNSIYVSSDKLLAEVSSKDFKINPVETKDIKKSKKGISVNANALLANTETEMYQSFRETAINRINKNFNAVKTLLANRNQEEEL